MFYFLKNKKNGAFIMAVVATAFFKTAAIWVPAHFLVKTTVPLASKIAETLLPIQWATETFLQNDRFELQNNRFEELYDHIGTGHQEVARRMHYLHDHITRGQLEVARHFAEAPSPEEPLPPSSRGARLSEACCSSSSASHARGTREGFVEDKRVVVEDERVGLSDRGSAMHSACMSAWPEEDPRIAAPFHQTAAAAALSLLATMFTYQMIGTTGAVSFTAVTSVALKVLQSTLFVATSSFSYSMVGESYLNAMNYLPILGDQKKRIEPSQLIMQATIGVIIGLMTYHTLGPQVLPVLSTCEKALYHSATKMRSIAETVTFMSAAKTVVWTGGTLIGAAGTLYCGATAIQILKSDNDDKWKAAFGACLLTIFAASVTYKFLLPRSSLPTLPIQIKEVAPLLAWRGAAAVGTIVTLAAGVFSLIYLIRSYRFRAKPRGLEFSFYSNKLFKKSQKAALIALVFGIITKKMFFPKAMLSSLPRPSLPSRCQLLGGATGTVATAYLLRAKRINKRIEKIRWEIEGLREKRDMTTNPDSRSYYERRQRAEQRALDPLEESWIPPMPGTLAVIMGLATFIFFGPKSVTVNIKDFAYKLPELLFQNLHQPVVKPQTTIPTL